MKTGIRFLLTVFLLILIISTSYGQKKESGTQSTTSVINTAPYVLFGGAYVLIGEQKGGDNRESAVFKLDTYTGKTWVLMVEKSVNGNAPIGFRSMSPPVFPQTIMKGGKVTTVRRIHLRHLERLTNKAENAYFSSNLDTVLITLGLDLSSFTDSTARSFAAI